MGQGAEARGTSVRVAAKLGERAEVVMKNQMPAKTAKVPIPANSRRSEGYDFISQFPSIMIVG
jgi:hypothetical protein